MPYIFRLRSMMTPVLIGGTSGWIMTHGGLPRDLAAQTAIAFDVRFGFKVQSQCLWRIQRWPADHLAVDQAVRAGFSTWVLVGTPSASDSSTAVSTACSSW